MKFPMIAAIAATACLAFAGAAAAEDFPATPMNSGPMMMMPMQPMMAPMAAPAAEQPMMMRKPMTMRQKRMMMKKQMMKQKMMDQQPMQ